MKILVRTAVFLLAALSSAVAAEWQWSVPDDTSRAYLWIPPACKQVRAVVVCNHNMIEQGILEHPVMRRTLAELGMAEVWIVPKMDNVFDFNKGAGAHFQKIMDALADESGYSELKSAPAVPMGHSASATWPWNFAAWNPGRTLAVLSIHGDAPQTDMTGYGRPNIDWGGHNIDGVPGLMVMGEYEWIEGRIAPAFAFLAKHPNTPMAFLCDAGHGHFDYSDQLVGFLAMFIRKAAAARLPADVPPGEPVVLRPVDPKNGWRVDRWRKDAPPTAPAAPFEKYAGNTNEAFWCFDAEMARRTEAYYARPRGKKPQLLGFVQDGKTIPQVDVHQQVNLRFKPDADGITCHLSAIFLDTVDGGSKNTTRWTGLPAGSPIGHATGGGPIRLSRIVGPVAQTGGGTFVVHFGRAEFTSDRRNYDAWILASHPGDAEYKSIVQQSMMHINPNTDGAEQRISFPKIADQKAGAKLVKLAATTDARLPVHYFVREGPAEVDGATLRLTAIPPRAKFPVKVTVVAWQWGRAAGPKVKTAERVEQTFQILDPAAK